MAGGRKPTGSVLDVRWGRVPIGYTGTKLNAVDVIPSAKVEWMTQPTIGSEVARPISIPGRLSRDRPNDPKSCPNRVVEIKFVRDKRVCNCRPTFIDSPKRIVDFWPHFRSAVLF